MSGADNRRIDARDMVHQLQVGCASSSAALEVELLLLAVRGISDLACIELCVKEFHESMVEASKKSIATASILTF